MRKVSVQVSIKLTPIKEENKYVELAAAFIELAASSIKKKLYTFIPVLNMLEFVPVEENVFICTDGEKIFYNPDDVIDKVKLKDMETIEKTILHIVFHGLLGHFENINWKNKKLSWVVQDIQVERCVRKIYPNKFGDSIGEKIWDTYICDELYYRGLKDKKFRKQIYKRAKQAHMDNHIFWSHVKIKSEVEDSANGNADMEAEAAGKKDGKVNIWKIAKKVFFGEKKVDIQNMEKEILNRLDVEKNGKKQGHGSLDLENTVTYTKESSMCYKELFERIAKLSEVVKEEQELDKVLYQYGLEMYGDVPLVEPEEISEKHCLHTIVVAVDTSGSCSHLAEKFLREIIAVFEEIKRIGKVEHICYLECDDRITAQKDYYGLQEFIDFGKTHTFTGYGGTSFVPVFKHADQLIEDGEQVDALIYITDAEGDFPEYEDKPNYEVYLLLDTDEEYWLEDEEYRLSWIPKWAECIRLYSE